MTAANKDVAAPRPVRGRAVGDEDPDRSPMDKPVGPAQPLDVEKVEKDRARSVGPQISPPPRRE